MKNIKNAGVDDIVIPIVKTSEEAAKNFNKPVEFIFIDGAFPLNGLVLAELHPNFPFRKTAYKRMC